MDNRVFLCDAKYIVITDCDIDSYALGYEHLQYAQAELEEREKEDCKFTHYLTEVKQTVNIKEAKRSKKLELRELEDTDVCPHCGSSDVEYVTFKDSMNRIKKKNHLICNDCKESGFPIKEFWGDWQT